MKIVEKCNGGRVLDRVRVFLVRETENGNGRCRVGCEHFAVKCPQGPIPAMAAVGDEGANQSCLAPGLSGEVQHSRKVALEISAGDT